MLKNEKGITLVALVITIIVLLILATVAITMAINSDGLFAKANEAAHGWNNAVDKEYEDFYTTLNYANQHGVDMSGSAPATSTTSNN